MWSGKAAGKVGFAPLERARRGKKNVVIAWWK